MKIPLKLSLIKTLKHFPKMSVRDVHKNLRIKYQDTPSTSTVFRAIHSSGKTAKNRVQWCKNNKKQDWDKIFFSDECSVWLERDSVRMWTRGAEAPLLNISRHVPMLHIWGAISRRGATLLKIFKNTFISSMYIDTLRECLLEMADLFYPEGWILQEDNSPIHTSKLSKSWKEERNTGWLNEIETNMLCFKTTLKFCQVLNFFSYYRRINYINYRIENIVIV